MMNKLSIKNRIATYSVLGIASLSLIVFIAIYFTVKNTIFNKFDKHLNFEAQKHLNELTYVNDSVYFVYKDEWLEREHIEVQTFPLYVEIVDLNGNIIDKSPNLYNVSLKFDLNRNTKFIVNQRLENKKIRQIQLPLINQGKKYGYLAISMSIDDSELLLKSLSDTLLIIYPILLIVTFFTSRIISRVTIKPITLIAKTVDEINSSNLNKRVPEPRSGDELETLSKAINDFLNRIDAAIKREKQFTADASHQLRTPLSVIKGNLEVLIRKERQTEEYVEEIQQNVYKIDSMANTLEKLLVLARLDNKEKNIEVEKLDIYHLTEAILTNYKQQILQKNISLNVKKVSKTKFYVNKTYLSLILDNLISNAVKYANPNTTIDIKFFLSKLNLKISISNIGPKISDKEKKLIFNPFYRNIEHTNTIKGDGLGLAIITKAAHLLDIKLDLSSAKTTTFSIEIPLRSQT
ncbi:Signal transduction histidine kinase [Psychroflexus halocasei]|uniref:histidine kinase n=2 Tax=Psychroflexus halocasei TaxID=908615 RepID=A0A1H3YEW9_9FLAO|nr:Signal transduction histidine kinase [Psychroflexus halocasei]